MKHIYTLLLATLLLGVNTLRAQNAGDYRSASTGEWSTISAWETYDGASLAAGLGCSGWHQQWPDYDSKSDDSIGDHYGSVHADELVIESGATLFTSRKRILMS